MGRGLADRLARWSEADCEPLPVNSELSEGRNRKIAKIEPPPHYPPILVGKGSGIGGTPPTFGPRGAFLTDAHHDPTQPSQGWFLAVGNEGSQKTLRLASLTTWKRNGRLLDA